MKEWGSEVRNVLHWTATADKFTKKLRKNSFRMLVKYSVQIWLATYLFAFSKMAAEPGLLYEVTTEQELSLYGYP